MSLRVLDSFLFLLVEQESVAAAKEASVEMLLPLPLLSFLLYHLKKICRYILAGS